MTTTTKRLDELPHVLLMGPGPSCVPPEVYQALARPTIGHLDPRFLAIMEDIKTLLRQVMGTGNSLTLPISGTGSAGMETSFVNLVEGGDRVLILSNGVFGQRMTDVAGRLRAEVDTLEFPWGTPVVPDGRARPPGGAGIRLVAVVHAETSTGVCNPVAEIGELVRALRRAVPGRYRDQPGRHPRDDGRLGCGRRVQRHAEVLVLPAGPVAGQLLRAGPGQTPGAGRPRCPTGTWT